MVQVAAITFRKVIVESNPKCKPRLHGAGRTCSWTPGSPATRKAIMYLREQVAAITLVPYLVFLQSRDIDDKNADRGTEHREI